MPVQTTLKEVDPGDVALSPETEICEEIYQRVLAEVRARIDDRIASIEAQAASEAAEATEDGDTSAAAPTAKRRPLMRAAVTLAASAGLVGAVATLARDHTETITSVTDRIEAAIQSIRRDGIPKLNPGGPSETAMSGASSPEAAPNTPAAPSSSAASLPDTTMSPEPSPARTSDPSSAMAEASPERDMPPAENRELAPLVEKIAHDVAELQAGLQDLKASQQQASRDQAKAIEQLQASQEQLARAVRATKTDAPPGVTAVRIIPRSPQGQARPPRFP
ncbi:conserved protein of unknown function [Bradyrhizobium sp. ORS 285]|uniref:hypothetical protein n=1 Tax=Bradyrhizobium sp. ORS 285 TaxID=115808 RepID=UPI00024084AA|nr:hypothetical protein [Bradyrhizobium sp. ORS 285]CCD88585.1 conserved hypothetical protein [Bradyrhizobium sp. ORS 285]SMX58518.1 conserved protein of unknown function [Bradyrhizobium sp. ORS 285]